MSLRSDVYQKYSWEDVGIDNPSSFGRDLWLLRNPPTEVLTDDAYMVKYARFIAWRFREINQLFSDSSRHRADRLSIVRAHTYGNADLGAQELFNPFEWDDARRPVIMRGSKALIQKQPWIRRGGLVERWFRFKKISPIAYFEGLAAINEESSPVDDFRHLINARGTHLNHSGNAFPVEGKLISASALKRRIRERWRENNFAPPTVSIPTPAVVITAPRIRLTRQQKAKAALSALEELGIVI